MKKQMSLIIRNFDKDDIGRICTFLECRNCLACAGLVYDQVIHELLESVCLDIIGWYRQGYDGAGAVGGIHKGLQAHIPRVIHINVVQAIS